MNPFRTKQIRRAILDTLKMARGYALEAAVLRTHVKDMLRPPMEDEEWTREMNGLEKGTYISGVESDLDPELKQWVITERGKSLLASDL